MSTTMNRAYILGSVVSCEGRAGPSGARLAVLVVSTPNARKVGNEWIDTPDYHRVVAPEPHAGYLLTWGEIKGASLAVECVIRSSKWAGADGVTRYETSLVVDRVLWLSRREHAHVSAPVIE